MSSTSPLPPAPNAQRRVPVLPRLLWLYFHQSKWIFLALLGFGVVFMTGTHFDAMSRKSPVTHQAPFLIWTINLLVFVSCYIAFYSIEKENKEAAYAKHRGFDIWLINFTKILFPIPLAILLAITISCFEQTLLWLNDLHPQATTFSTGPSFFNFVKYAIFYGILTIFVSLMTQSTMTALVLLGLAAFMQLSYLAIFIRPLANFLTGSQDSSAPSLARSLVEFVLEILPLTIAIAGSLLWRTYHDRLALPISSKRNYRLRETSHLPVSHSTWQRLQWLHAIQSRPLLIAASIVCLAAFIQPIMTSNESGNLPERYVFGISGSIYLLFCGVFVLSPEHANAAYRFWNDRGLSPSLILKSRLWKYFKITLPAILLSGFLFMLSLSWFCTVSPVERYQLWTFRFLNSEVPYGDRYYPFISPDNVSNYSKVVAYLLLIPLPVSLVCSWLSSRLIVTLAVTGLCQFALWLIFALTLYLSIPIWVVFLPVAFLLWSYLFWRFADRFLQQIPRSLTIKTAILAPIVFTTTFLSASIYRVYEVPSINPDPYTYPISRHPGQRVITLADDYLKAPPPTPFKDNETFETKLRTLLETIRDDYDLPQLKAQAQGQSLQDDLVASYGWNYLEPRLQELATSQRSLADSLEKLLLLTPCQDMTISLTESAKKENDPLTRYLYLAQRLLINTAKQLEQEGQLDIAIDYYNAANRLPEIFLMRNAADYFPFMATRNYLLQNLVSWINHPDQTQSRVERHLDELIERPFDRASDEQLATRTFNQIHTFILEPSPSAVLKEWGNQLNNPMAFTPGWYLPTERQRFARLLDLQWKQWLTFPGCLRVYSMGASTEYTWSRVELCDRFLKDQMAIQQLQETTLFAYQDGRRGSPLWLIDPIHEGDLYSDYHRIMEAESTAIARLAWTFMKRWISPEIRDLQEVQNTLQNRLLKQSPLELAFYNRLENLPFRIITLDPDLPYSGSGLFNRQYLLGQQILLLDSPLGPSIQPWSRPEIQDDVLTIPVSIGSYSSYLVLPNLQRPPSIPDYQRLTDNIPENERKAYIQSLYTRQPDQQQ